MNEIISAALRRENFWVRPDLILTWHPPAREEIPWEVFRGRLLDPAHTRQTKSFISWSVYQMDGSEQSSEPLLSVKWDEERGAIHVVRAILSHVWIGVGAGANVIESRETTRWVRELVGTIITKSHTADTELRFGLMHLIRAAVEGTSRLPVTSVEAPLPAFSLGQLAYLPRLNEERHVVLPLTAWEDLVPALPQSLETLLRALTPEQAPQAARLCAESSWAAHLSISLRDIFNRVSLSPYTSFVETTMAFVKGLTARGGIAADDEIDLWSWLLRQLGRHLTAYDLVTFHYRGANYPDALLLDAVLKRYVELIDTHPRSFTQANDSGAAARLRLRRRALRQGCLHRRHYEGLAVPDMPTSPGENARVLPAPFLRVPEEQLLNVLRRRKRLYADDPLPELLSARSREVFAESLRDLAEAVEWRELGTALFVERPLGWAKEVGEPDLTPLLAHEAFSPSIASRRFSELQALARALSIEGIDWDQARTQENSVVAGVPAAALAPPPRPVLALADARRVADDFVIVRTLPRGLSDLFAALDFDPLRAFTAFPDPGARLVVARFATAGGQSVLAWFDGHYRKRLEMMADASQGYLSQGGLEMPAGSLRVTRMWDEQGSEVKISAAIAVITPRIGAGYLGRLSQTSPC